MNWMTILNVLFSLIGVASFGILAYCGWLHLRQLGSTPTRRPPLRKERTRAGWPRVARTAA